MLPMVTLPGSSMTVSGVTVPVCSAATAVISLKVDPVGYRPAIARLYRGAPFAVDWSLFSVDCEIGLEKTLGSNYG